MNIRHLFISEGHNFRGHHGRPPSEHPITEVEEVECVAGTGLRGDRYFGHKEDFKGQITFFAWEVLDAMRKELKASDCAPSAMRRNVITDGVDLNTLIGKCFELQGVRFEGAEECRPCYWMDQAVAEGAEDFLKGKGGLRARILSSGTLRRGDAAFRLLD